MYLYVVETCNTLSSQTDMNVICEISNDELQQLNKAFKICGIYHGITQIKEIVVENGEAFKKYMSPENLLKIRSDNISPERAIMLANKFVLNYASSIKTYIDMETRLLKKHCEKSEISMFEKMCNHFYDNNLEYRFWANFRNYIVHCEFPYSIYQDSIENGCKIICTKENLLKFDNWKHSKDDILKMNDIIDLPSMVDKMSSMIYALYIDFFSHFTKDISDGISIYGEFCRKYNVKIPAILKTYEKDEIAGSHIQPLPTKELHSVIKLLKTNPRVEFNIQA